jgi:hypothetical protein
MLTPDFIDNWLLICLKVFGFLVIVVEVKALIKGFKGGNHLYQFDEIAKVSIILLLFYMAVIEGKREDLAHNVYPVSLYILLLFAILVMAKLETAIEKFIELVKAWKGVIDKKSNIE